MGIAIAGALALLLIWKLAVMLLNVPPYILPAPEGVFTALWSGIAVSPASPLGFYLPLWSTTVRTRCSAFLIGAGLGLIVGSLMAEFRPVETALMPYAFALQSLAQGGDRAADRDLVRLRRRLEDRDGRAARLFPYAGQ